MTRFVRFKLVAWRIKRLVNADHGGNHGRNGRRLPARASSSGQDAGRLRGAGDGRATGWHMGAAQRLETRRPALEGLPKAAA